MDKLTKKQRSECMSHIKGKNTGLEKIFRKSVSGLEIRGYRLHPKIPGSPDMFFPKHNIAVFIDGCFWHGCPRCGSLPSTNVSFWKKKIDGNKRRDKAVRIELRKLGIKTIRFWGHEVKNNPDKCTRKLLSALTDINRFQRTQKPARQVSDIAAIDNQLLLKPTGMNIQ